MKLRISSVIFVMSVAFPVGAIADDAVAIQYAQEAVEVMRADFDRLQKLFVSGSIPASVVQPAQSQLHDAELTLFRLQGDNASVKRVLQTEVDRETDQFERHQSLVKRGYTGGYNLSTGEIRLLIARHNLATHTGDQASAILAVRRATEIEESKLQSLVHLLSRGHTNRSAIAKQKLRIARLIATQKITLPPSS